MTPIPAKSQVLLHDLEFHLFHLFGQAAQADAMPKQDDEDEREGEQAEEEGEFHLIGLEKGGFDSVRDGTDHQWMK